MSIKIKRFFSIQGMASWLRFGCYLHICLLVLTSFGVVQASTNQRLESVPHILLAMGSERGAEYAIIVEKESQQLFVYQYNGSFKEVFKTDCSTGKNSGPKTRSGDSKTPEGIYFFVQKHAKDDLSVTYGAGAFPIDYPNIIDRLAGSTGNSIWLHGTNKALMPRDSNGCIVLTDETFLHVARYIQLNRTPMIIVERLTDISINNAKDTEAAIHDFLKAWNSALQDGTYHQLLHFYDSEYLPEINWWVDWNRFRREMRRSGFNFAVAFDHVSIFRHKDTLVVLFDQSLSSTTVNLEVTTKKMFVKSQKGRFKIIGEEFQTAPKRKIALQHNHPLVASLQNLSQQHQELHADQELIDVIDGWLAAWSSKDIKRFGRYYSRDFKTRRMGIRSWLQYKQQLNQKYAYIRVSKKNLEIRRGKAISRASFIQVYESDQYQVIGVKHLVLKKEEGQWRIYRETWEKL